MSARSVAFQELAPDYDIKCIRLIHPKTFEKFYVRLFFPTPLPLTGRSPESKKIHPHRSLGRSGRRHSTAGGRNVSRQYVSHFDRNTDHVRAPGISAEDERSERRRRQGDSTRIRPTRVSPYTTIEFMTFWSRDWRCVKCIPGS